MARHPLNRWLYPPPRERSDQIQARIRRRHYDRIVKIAKDTATNRSKVVRAIICEYFDTLDGRNGRKKKAA